ncbi:hypothetical protein LDENG_00042450, partial [Lucifuga dentata]
MASNTAPGTSETQITAEDRIAIVAGVSGRDLNTEPYHSTRTSPRSLTGAHSQAAHPRWKDTQDTKPQGGQRRTRTMDEPRNQEGHLYEPSECTSRPLGEQARHTPKAHPHT